MSAEITGLDELIKNLHTLGERVQRKVVRQAVNRALTPLVKAARSHAPEESGLLRESIGKKIKTYTSDMTVLGIVGPRIDTEGEFEGKKRVPWRYAHLVEDGHIDQHGNYVPAHPFLRPAFDESVAKMTDIMGERLGKGIEKEAAKEGK